MSEQNKNELPLLDRSMLGTGRFYVSYDLLDELTRYEFDPVIVAVRIRLLMALAYGRVSYYTPPQNVPFLAYSDDRMARICDVEKEEWTRIKDRVAEAFDVRDGVWRLKGDPLYVAPPGRRPISTALRSAVFSRDGKICAYCGETEGPFEIDHIHPVSRGGTDDLANLAVACFSCNRGKSNLTLKEWRGE